jgi:myo-inositol-1(or 4)-monophosphatase
LNNSNQNNLDLPQILDAANSAAAAASKVLLARFRPDNSNPLDSFYKSPNALVTDADLASDRAISEALKTAGVPGRILSEESETVLSGDNDSLTWLVDPLCGTVPFSTGMDHWGVNIALRSAGELVVASLPLPSLGEQLSATRGNGVIRNGEPLVSTSPRENLAESTIGLEIDGPDEWRRKLASGLEWIPTVSQINTFASTAYPMAMICMGRLPAAVFYGIEPVHVAAGTMIASELGVLVTDDSGVDINWSEDGELPVVVIGWPVIHEQLIAAMNA